MPPLSDPADSVSPAVTPPENRYATLRVWLGFAAMCLGMFMAILDIQIVATSLPAIQGALGIAPEQMSWVQTAYLIAEIIAIPLTGFLTRVLGIRWLFLSAIAAFTLASIGCAASGGFASLVTWRVVQGFSGGALIPLVFSAVFLFFPVRRQDLATMLAGVLAVLAPSLGPIAGGWVTETYTWPWLFLINVGPGIAAFVCGHVYLPREAVHPRALRGFDVISLALMATALTALEITLKEAPLRGWTSGFALALAALSAASAAGFMLRIRNSEDRLVDLDVFRDRNFTIGCVLNFIFGAGLFGSVYLMPVFLAFVRYHDALEIGRIMLVTGATQLLAAPLAVMLERRMDARFLTAAGFMVFTLGLACSALQTPRTDYDAMFWPQIIRGFAIMFCLLPTTRMALGTLTAERIPNASGIFNLMRNLGGAIGIALIDSMIYGRSARHGQEIMEHLRMGDPHFISFVGLSAEAARAGAAMTPDAAAQEMLRPIIERAALTQSMNEAWALIAIATLLSVGFLAMAHRVAPASGGVRH